MTDLNEKTKNSLLTWFRLCPLRHVLILLGGLLIGAYFALRGRPGLMQRVSERFVRPWHRFASRLCSHLPFSVAEGLIVLGVLLALGYLVFTLVQLIRKPDRRRQLYRLLITCLAAFAMLYGGFCLFWGVYYDCADFETQSGIYAKPLDAAQLETVTRYFTELVNRWDSQIQRDPDGAFAEDQAEIFARSPHLYDNVVRDFPCLAGDPIGAKPFFFSRCMSYTNFTGFFFPFTGEANINTDAPPALLASTIAHELAHQRGVAEEDEANFVAVLASLESGDPVYAYSACLMAYIHLGNALYQADYDAWLENYGRLCAGARRDLADNRAYWAQFETPVSTVSDSVYTGFLHSYGQTLGLQTYGKCVDLLVAYYYNSAELEATK